MAMTVPGCSLCGKSLKKINILTEMHVEAYSQHVTTTGELEDMNGQWKHVKEYVCETCLEKIIASLQQLRTNPKK